MTTLSASPDELERAVTRYRRTQVAWRLAKLVGYAWVTVSLLGIALWVVKR